MFFLGRFHLVGHVFQLRCIVFNDFFGAANPRAFTENLFYILGENNFARDEQVGQFVVTVAVFLKDFLCTVVLFVHHLHHFVVDNLRRCFRIWLLELVFLVVVETDVGQLIAHTSVCHHAVCTLCGSL